MITSRLVLRMFLMIYCLCPSFQQEPPFVYNGFDQAGNNLHLDGGARILPHNGALQLTNDTLRQMGHAFLQQPIDYNSSEPVSFSTHFVCALLPAGYPSGHGMAFVVSQSTDFSHAEPTRYFGIFNASSNESTSARVLAVELDTALAPELKDISDNHVGIDVNSAVSKLSANASYFSDKEGKSIEIKLLSGDPIQVWVDYQGTMLNVTLAPLKTEKPSRPLLSAASINLTEIVQGRRMFFGFSGATGSIMSYQYVLGWSLSKTMGTLQSIDFSKLPKVDHPSYEMHIRSRRSVSSSSMARWLLQILIITSLHLISPSSQQETSFVYQNFTSQENLYLDASAKVLLPSGLLQLTNTSDYQMGRAFHKKPIQLITSFSTHFVCALVAKPGVEPGHGLTFLISPSLDFSYAESTRYLGAFNASRSPALAVELDTIWNPEFNDIKVRGGHVGIDVNDPISIAVAPASYYSKGGNVSLNLLSGNPIQVWVDYDGSMLNVSLAPLEVEKPSRPLLSHPINLSDIFPNRSKLFVGFSAATGNSVCDHYILWWSFTTSGGGSLEKLDISKLPQVPHPTSHPKKLPQWIIIMIVCLGVAVLAVLAGVYFHRRKKFSEVSETWEKEFDAHRFSYKSLYKATKGFSKDEFLGKGGFGEVYRGKLPQGREIAVKRVSHNGDEGVKQFVAEVVSMRCLKHRNLVPLFGYCRRKRELLLVSEYMPNGSLDEHLFDEAKRILSWKERLVVVKGIASALWYLHTGADQVVLHRDIKASNIMLDEEFNGRLGDFGMARFHEHGGSAATTAAVGTVGYMAPELITMGASTGTDVYAFGVFMLEVTCGRRPVEPQLEVEKRHMIKWVCECWKKDSLLNAIDPRLGDEFSPEEVEMVMKLGLLCSNIVPESRPTMEQVVLYLNENMPLPDFSPYTLGIGTFAPVLVDAASLVVSSASWSWSASSSANHSPYAYQGTDQPWGQTVETKNSLHIVSELEKPKTQTLSSAVKTTVTSSAEDLESNLSSISSQR
ncbi:unnamed protein product [Brassica rapa subsp. trilocularis]